MLRGIDPSVHGIRDNTPLPLSEDWPSFLLQARQAGLSTAAMLNWLPIDTIVEPDAVDQRYFLNGGYAEDDDAVLAGASAELLAARPDVAFAYLVSPDNAGHDHGWGSEPYLQALRRSDDALAQLLALVEDEVAILVTTDHGGHGNDHQLSEPIDMVTFMTLRAPGIAPASHWDHVSILDVAPTVAALAGFDPAPSWSGRSLLGSESPIVDHLLGLVSSMSEYHYGEDVSMLEHSLQTANHLRADGATRELAVAGLLHDIGHLLGEAGNWGLPDHAAVGAQYLQAWLPASVVEPIRHHVDAKRFLVTDRPGYHDELSEASKQTLRQQGGPFSTTEASAFGDLAWSEEAVLLRLADDAGKSTDVSTTALEAWRVSLEQLLISDEPSPTALRDSCSFSSCRDATSGQRLLTAQDLSGWTVLGQIEDTMRLRHVDGTIHDVVPLEQPVRDTSSPPAWSDVLSARHDISESLDEFSMSLATNGIAIGGGLGSRPGRVLDFATSLGHLRITNYGDLFEVRNEPDATNLAYTTLGLPLHTDNPYRDPVPTIQILHCLQPAANGGDSMFADGIAAAETFRTSNPKDFDVLAATPVDFAFTSPDVELRTCRTVIALSPAGAVQMVAVNHRSMQPLIPGPTTDRFYEAYLRFVELIEDDLFCTNVKLQVGEVVAFDNRRILHARTAFSSDEPRHLQGCYIDVTPRPATAQLT